MSGWFGSIFKSTDLFVWFVRSLARLIRSLDSKILLGRSFVRFERISHHGALRLEFLNPTQVDTKKALPEP